MNDLKHIPAEVLVEEQIARVLYEAPGGLATVETIERLVADWCRENDIADHAPTQESILATLERETEFFEKVQLEGLNADQWSLTEYGHFQVWTY